MITSLKIHPNKISPELLVKFMDKLVKDGHDKYVRLVNAGKMTETAAAWDYNCLLQVKNYILEKEAGTQSDMFNNPAPAAEPNPADPLKREELAEEAGEP
jgi:hypothetical protein